MRNGAELLVGVQGSRFGKSEGSGVTGGKWRKEKGRR